VAAVAQFNLAAGFSIIGMVYAVAFVSAIWPAPAEVGEVTSTK